jgi:hypothetical protein
LASIHVDVILQTLVSLCISIIGFTRNPLIVKSSNFPPFTFIPRKLHLQKIKSSDKMLESTIVDLSGCLHLSWIRLATGRNANRASLADYPSQKLN